MRTPGAVLHGEQPDRRGGTRRWNPLYSAPPSSATLPHTRHRLTPSSLLTDTGEPGDTVQFAEYVERNLRLYQIRFVFPFPPFSLCLASCSPFLSPPCALSFHPPPAISAPRCLRTATTFPSVPPRPPPGSAPNSPPPSAPKSPTASTSSSAGSTRPPRLPTSTGSTTSARSGPCRSRRMGTARTLR